MGNSYTEYLAEQQEDTQASLRSQKRDIQHNVRESLWPDEAAWVQYVKDHYRAIKEKSLDTQIDPNDAKTCAYSLSLFLQKYEMPLSMTWIVAWLNQIDSDLHFTPETTSLLMPDQSQLEQMKQQYITTRVTHRKATGTTSL